MRPSRLAAALAAALTGASLASCGTQAEPTASTESSSAPTAQFPLTIRHALGETTLEAQPERVATVSWANHEVPIALGVVPVGMSKGPGATTTVTGCSRGSRRGSPSWGRRRRCCSMRRTASTSRRLPTPSPT